MTLEASSDVQPMTIMRFGVLATICRAAGTASAGSPRVSNCLQVTWRPRMPPAALMARVAGRHAAKYAGPSCASAPVNGATIPTTNGASAPAVEAAGPYGIPATRANITEIESRQTSAGRAAGRYLVTLTHLLCKLSPHWYARALRPQPVIVLGSSRDACGGGLRRRRGRARHGISLRGPAAVAGRYGRRHADRVGPGDPDGRRPGAARRRLPAGGAGALPGDPVLRTLREGPAVPAGLARPMAAPDRRASRGRAGIERPLPELGGRRPREMGAGRVRLRPRRLARRGPLPRIPGPVLPARDPRLLPVHRVGRRAGVEQRQSRSARDFLLCHQPVARRLTAAPASGRDLPVGGGGGLVSGHVAPRRHGVRLLGQLDEEAGDHGTARPRRPRPREPQYGAAGGGTRDTARARTGGEPRRPSPGDLVPSPRRGVPSRAIARLVPHHGSAAVRGELGRAGPASPGELRRLHAGGVPREMARGARARALARGLCGRPRGQ